MSMPLLGTPEFQAIAKLTKDGELGLQVTGFCTYGNRTTTRSVAVTLDEKDAEKITKIFQKAIDAANVEVVKRTGERDENDNIIYDDEMNSLREIKQIPLGQMVASDAMAAYNIATSNGEEL